MCVSSSALRCGRCGAVQRSTYDAHGAPSCWRSNERGLCTIRLRSLVLWYAPHACFVVVQVCWWLTSACVGGRVACWRLRIFLGHGTRHVEHCSHLSLFVGAVRFSSVSRDVPQRRLDCCLHCGAAVLCGHTGRQQIGFVLACCDRAVLSRHYGSAGVHGNCGVRHSAEAPTAATVRPHALALASFASWFVFNRSDLIVLCRLKWRAAALLESRGQTAEVEMLERTSSSDVAKSGSSDVTIAPSSAGSQPQLFNASVYRQSSQGSRRSQVSSLMPPPSGSRARSLGEQHAFNVASVVAESRVSVGSESSMRSHSPMSDARQQRFHAAVAAAPDDVFSHSGSRLTHSTPCPAIRSCRRRVRPRAVLVPLRRYWWMHRRRARVATASSRCRRSRGVKDDSPTIVVLPPRAGSRDAKQKQQPAATAAAGFLFTDEMSSSPDSPVVRPLATVPGAISFRLRSGRCMPMWWIAGAGTAASWASYRAPSRSLRSLWGPQPQQARQQLLHRHLPQAVRGQ